MIFILYIKCIICIKLHHLPVSASIEMHWWFYIYNFDLIAYIRYSTNSRFNLDITPKCYSGRKYNSPFVPIL